MLESLSRSAALELAPLGVTVNTVCPGPTQTGWIWPELEERLLPEMPLGRLGTPEDVADVVVFLCTEQGCWLTGQTLYVGGGHRLS
jgi:3-oxoacyl-[acyl-carrier protein] reductase